MIPTSIGVPTKLYKLAQAAKTKYYTIDWAA